MYEVYDESAATLDPSSVRLGKSLVNAFMIVVVLAGTSEGESQRPRESWRYRRRGQPSHDRSGEPPRGVFFVCRFACRLAVLVSYRVFVA